MPEYLAIANALHEIGWISYPNFLNADEIHDLAEHLHRLNATGLLYPAKIGRMHTEQHNESIRGDAIAWLQDDAQHPLVRAIEDKFDLLRLGLNRELMLGLFEYEGHFASYAPGSGYKKHIDQFQDADTRRISCVLYLNPPDWCVADGGALRLFLDGKSELNFVDLFATGGTLVLFLSHRFYHEVLTTHRERLSLTGWFRVREKVARR